MRLLAVSLPFVLVAGLELAFRITGSWRDTSGELTEVGFEAGAHFFPEWETEIEMPRPDGTLRIFVLGGSTTRGYGVERSFATVLQDRLVEELDGRRVEVINGGYPAYGSHRVLAITRRATRFQPDLVIVYMGHNEFLEDVFYDPGGIVARLDRARGFARRFRVANWARHLAGNPTELVHSKLPAEFLGNQDYPLIRSRAEYELRLKLLDRHVREMTAACRSAGTPIVFVPAVPNLLFPPGDSVHGPGFDPSSNRWPGLSARAEAEFERQDWKALAVSCDELEQLDDEYAQVHFWRGLALLGQDRAWEGAAALVKAVDLDRRGTRSNTDIGVTIVTAARAAGAGVLDVANLFHGNGLLADEFKRRAAGEDQQLFIDHCHPTEEGHRRIAAALVPEVMKALGR